jgi:hypothetical protein
LEDDKLMA